MPRPIWTQEAFDAVRPSIRARAILLLDELADRFTPPVPEVRIIADPNIEDAGQFWFTATGQPDSILVNVLELRTLHDAAYTLLHEIRHAHQLAKLGIETMSSASSRILLPGTLGYELESDAAAWGVDQTTALQLPRRILRDGARYATSVYKLHAGQRLDLRIRWPSW
jgi:hypothetical protein